MVKNIGVSLFNGVRDHPIFDDTTVNKEKLLVRLGSGMGGQSNPSP